MRHEEVVAFLAVEASRVTQCPLCQSNDTHDFQSIGSSRFMYNNYWVDP